jgi:hypothetical protein
MVLLLALIAAAAATPGAILYIQEDETVVRESPSGTAGEVMRLAQGHKVMEYERQGAWINVGIFDTLGLEGWVPEARLGARPPGEPLDEPPEASAAATEASEATTASSVQTPLILMEVAGTPALSFIGNCRLSDGAGNIERRKIKGLVTKRFSFGAEAVSCTVQKWQSRGRLEVAMWWGDELIAANETSGPFNFVRVRTDGPWGEARSSRGGVGVPVFRGNADRGVVPPLSVPTIPSFGPPVPFNPLLDNVIR